MIRVGVATVFDGSIGLGVKSVPSLVKLSVIALFVAVGAPTCT